MDADERLTALKKAYADIILNTAKEAAARIMVSERKALRFQHELLTAKEEALQMLLRLKHMMDSKIIEAEMTSFSQQRKIEELELQLQEAEDIVKDLREELREVQSALERAANKEVTDLKHDLVTPLETSADPRLDISQSIVLPPPELQWASISVSGMRYSNINQRNEGQKFFNTLVPSGNSYVGNSELPSIILRSKEPELYRNGCTQRVRACERTPLDRDPSFSDKVNDKKHESVVKEDEEGERVCKAPVCGPNTMCDTEKNDAAQDSVSSWYQVRIAKSIRKKRKRTTRFTKIRNPSCGYQSDQLNKIDQAPDISCLNISSSAKDVTPGKDDLFDTTQIVSSDTNGQEHGFPDTKADADSTVNGVDLVRDELVSMGQDRNNYSERSEAPSGQTNIGKVDLPLVNSESKALDSFRMIPLPPVNDRVIKYTFQRKRKRETLNSSEGNARENLNKDDGNASIRKQDAGEKENGSLEAEKSNLVAESSRDRRLSQVARQLISMSGKKWWQ